MIIAVSCARAEFSLDDADGSLPTQLVYGSMIV